MDAMIVYDTRFGNTKKVADTIGELLRQRYAVRVLPITEAEPVPAGIDLLLVGGPTHAHGVSAEMNEFLATIERDSERGVAAAAFDTRFKMPRLLSGSAATP